MNRAVKDPHTLLQVTRREWLVSQVALLATQSLRPYWDSRAPLVGECLVPGILEALALLAVEAAHAAGAVYADARLTRVVVHYYNMRGHGGFSGETEEVGIGVRALVGGAWGFAASPFWTRESVTRLAQDAVAQAKTNARWSTRVVELGTIPVVTGTWATPVRIDPFAIPIEEKLDAIGYWKDCATRAGCPIPENGGLNGLTFAREERVLATSEGSLVTQTLYNYGGQIYCQVPGVGSGFVGGLTPRGEGWERVLDAQIPEQLTTLKEKIQAQAALQRTARPSEVGRYTLVCDGATMAALVEQTLGVATQLDRALGYEANAGGTSIIDDPLAMVGHLQVASPHVTVTANRTAPTQLATVAWDDDGVVPEPFPLVQDGVLVDFQTTREQAAWLAPYYQRQGKPGRSHGCAAAQDAHYISLQHMPNLALAPSPTARSLEALVADVPEGILLEGGVVECDFQARTGLLQGAMRTITHGKLGPPLTGGAVQFETLPLWHNVIAVGGAQTEGGTDRWIDGFNLYKGEPPQRTSHSVRAVAATITNQALIDPQRRA
jgi:TldD protein